MTEPHLHKKYYFSGGKNRNGRKVIGGSPPPKNQDWRILPPYKFWAKSVRIFSNAHRHDTHLRINYYTSMPETDHGKTLMRWDFPEYAQYQRGRAWYIVATVITVGAFLLSAFTGNPLFAVFIALVVAIWVIRNRRPPTRIFLRITEDGLQVASAFYPYDSVRSFWIIYKPPEVKRLYIGFKNTLRTNLSLLLENQNPVKVREILLKFIQENLEQEGESISDALQRLLKF